MLKLTDRAQKELHVVLAKCKGPPQKLRIFTDHRCHLGKAHFSLALAAEPDEGDTAFEVGGVAMVADHETAKELACVEVDYVVTAWTEVFTIRNLNHECEAT